MVGEIDDSFQFINMRLNGKNYLYWSDVMTNFLKSKKMSYIIGTSYKYKNKEDEKYAKLLDT